MSYNNKREFQRVKSNTALTLIHCDTMKEIPGLCIDISQGGMGIRVNHPLSIGTECYLKIHDGRPTASKYQAVIEIRRVNAVQEDGEERFILGARVLERF